MLKNWTVLSLLVHASTIGVGYAWFVLRTPPPIVAELDLSMTPLISLPENAGGGYGKASEEWIAAKKGKKTPLPVVAEKIETKEEVQKQEAGMPCVGPCPETATGTGWGGGSGLGDGEYVPAENMARKPRWIRNFITASDYPLVARQEGKDGRVVLTVLIDAEGRVRDARLLQGSYEVLNEVALRKVMGAVFTPAYNDQRKPVSCKVTLPIRFELK